jgi:ribonucleotide monophosphatase NagD (HAD superfamily)
VPVDLDQFDAVLLDLDGTVYHEEYALPGAVMAIRKLQDRGKLYACLTNSTTGPHHLAARLARMGVTVEPQHIYTAASATCDYILDHFGGINATGYQPKVYNLSTEGVEELLDGRVGWVQREDEPCDVVVSGVPTNLYATEERQRGAGG